MFGSKKQMFFWKDPNDVVTHIKTRSMTKKERFVARKAFNKYFQENGDNGFDFLAKHHQKSVIYSYCNVSFLVNIHLL